MKKLRSLTSSTTIAALAGVLLISSVAVASMPEAQESKAKSGFTKAQLKTVKKLIAKQKGPTGVAGAAGAQGTQGAQGLEGAKGDRGPSRLAFTGFPATQQTGGAATNFTGVSAGGVLLELDSKNLVTLSLNGTVSGSTTARTLSCDLDSDGITVGTIEASGSGTSTIAMTKQFVVFAGNDPLFPQDGKVQLNLLCRSMGSTGTVTLASGSSQLSAIEFDTID